MIMNGYYDNIKVGKQNYVLVKYRRFSRWKVLSQYLIIMKRACRWSCAIVNTAIISAIVNTAIISVVSTSRHILLKTV
jgi:hypothetical protein